MSPRGAEIQLKEGIFIKYPILIKLEDTYEGIKSGDLVLYTAYRMKCTAEDEYDLSFKVDYKEGSFVIGTILEQPELRRDLGVEIEQQYRGTKSYIPAYPFEEEDLKSGNVLYVKHHVQVEKMSL